jgi:sialate O-acetylesterase
LIFLSCLALLLFSACLPATFDPVTNPGFESGALAPWVLDEGTATVVSEYAPRSGTYALRVGPSSSVVEQVIRDLEPDTAYTLVGWAKVEARGEEVRIGVRDFGGLETWTVTTTTVYSRASITFATGAENTQATVFCQKASGGGGAFCDDVDLTPGTPAEPDDLALSPLFGDGAVLQRNVEVPVWGTAPGGASVTVTFRDQTASTTAGDDGAWEVQLAPMPASKTPATMTASAGRSDVTVHDVRVGEVWLCSGQSNMWFPLNDAVGGQAAISDTVNHDIGVFQVWWDRRTTDQARWINAGPDNAGGTSAVCYFFAHALAHTLGPDVPFGLLQASKGGTDVAEWTHAGDGEADGQLYDTKIRPMQPYAIRGVVWYQGENEAGSPHRAATYAIMLPALIDEWRAGWGQGDLPFGIVQLTGLDGGAGWPIVRRAQWQTSLTVPHTFLAITLDLPLGAEPIHPVTKEPVGTRLALGARAVAYGEDIDCLGLTPDPDRSYVSGDRVFVAFDGTWDGLTTTDGRKPYSFELAGADGRFKFCAAQIAGDTLVVSSEEVAEPVAVRYGSAGSNLASTCDCRDHFTVPSYCDKRPVLPFELAFGDGEAVFTLVP